MQVSLAFPAVLERLQLQAFDMCKMIDAFVRHEPLLMRELRRHLFSVDERILESLAWKPGSSLYPLIALACSTAAPVRPSYPYACMLMHRACCLIYAGLCIHSMCLRLSQYLARPPSSSDLAGIIA